MKAERLQADVQAFLAAGGSIQACDSSHNAAARAPARMTRQEFIAYRKRLDGATIEAAIMKRQGVKP